MTLPDSLLDRLAHDPRGREILTRERLASMTALARWQRRVVALATAAKPILTASRAVSHDGLATLTVTEAELVQLEAAFSTVKGDIWPNDEDSSTRSRS